MVKAAPVNSTTLINATMTCFILWALWGKLSNCGTKSEINDNRFNYSMIKHVIKL